MRLSAFIILADAPLVVVSVETAFDATGIEAGNHLRRAILDATSHDEHDPRFDQFLLATAACDWVVRAFRGRVDAVATVPCSDGRPMTTQDVPAEYARHVDPAEPIMLLSAKAETGVTRTSTTIMTSVPDASGRIAA